ncbi:hypothetical protein [Wenjunlia tyrosinilytica]|uniref:Uncharacterized protein n=1 Tax=Wenjunlia tyrosinilytica TaxID=1544741 RepID=A0A917ZXA5_9ACTN|nr:hypothetical protein [Wenjunlia tyrosinilytica]GGO98650.1 hypothetical protein GCM10012280_63280 [Wenjunlia tyrosinilytica]
MSSPKPKPTAQLLADCRRDYEQARSPEARAAVQAQADRAQARLDHGFARPDGAR